MTPIGVVHSPFKEKVSAPRQAAAGKGIVGTIELYPGRGFEHALEDLEGWDRLWIVFVFDRNEGWRPKVLPPRSAGRRRGVFSTRSPHRPNPIGLSVVELVAVHGLTVTIRDLDILDGSPVLDIKPYVPYADAFPDARAGWLEGAADPAPAYEVRWSERAAAQAHWLRDHGIDLAPSIDATLALGPQPNAYRRIRKDDRGGLRLAIKEWRVRFDADDRVLHVREIVTGYRESQLHGASDAALDVHRAFVARFASAT
jgi:tRNA-Thr(GGU) m(6)t(6)A37 methyltransferase TsaA